MKTNCEYGTKVDYAQLVKIWEACFGDPREDILRFLEAHEGKMEIAICKVDGLIVSALYLLPLVCKESKVSYIYAVGTHPEYQGLGYCEKLLRWIRQKREECFILVPAGEKLRKYYEKRGYKLLQEKKKIYQSLSLMETAEGTPEIKKTFSIKEIDGDSYLGYRENLVKNQYGSKSLLWDRENINYIWQDIVSTEGGFAISISEANSNNILGIALGQQYGSALQMLELLLINPADSSQILKMLMFHYGCSQGEAELIPEIMVSYKDDSHDDLNGAYFNLTMG